MDIRKVKDLYRYRVTSDGGETRRVLLTNTTAQRAEAKKLFAETERFVPISVDDDNDELECGNESLLWLGLRKDGSTDRQLVRGPVQHVKTYYVDHFYSVNGIQFLHLEQLQETVVREWVWHRDIWGFENHIGLYRDSLDRKVVGITERFPVYDSSDGRCEDRYYRNWYLCENDSMTGVFYADGMETFAVITDMAQINPHHLEMIKEQGYLF